jgi:acylphosphatase
MAEEGGDTTALNIRIHGFVQAVNYRNFAIAEARRLGLDGWVRNRSDGTVEALASGPAKDVEAFIAACARGPKHARVKNVDLAKAEPPAEKGFNRRPSI